MSDKPATMADIAMLANWIGSLRLQVENHKHDEDHAEIERVREIVEDALAGGHGCEPTRAEYRKVLLRIRDIVE